MVEQPPLLYYTHHIWSLVSMKHGRSPSHPTCDWHDDIWRNRTVRFYYVLRNSSGTQTSQWKSYQYHPPNVSLPGSMWIGSWFSLSIFFKLQHTDLYWMTNDVTPKEEFISGSELHKCLSLDSSAGAWQVMNVVLDRIHHIWERKHIEKTQGHYK